jgi:DNA invertase Pin-like site-specific DNA recombinase
VAGFEAQLRELKAAGCERIFREQVSSVADRAELETAVDFVRDGDVFVVTKLDRLARSVIHLWSIVEALKAKNVALRILDFGIDTGTPAGRMFLTVAGGFAQFEREVMLERQREGIAAARKAGKYRGRAPTARAKADLVHGLKAAGKGCIEIARELKIGRASVYRILGDAAITGAAD